MAHAWKHYFSVDAVIGTGAVAFEEKIAALSQSFQTFVMLIFQSCEHVVAACWPPDYPTRSSPAGDFETMETQFRSKMLAVVAEHPEYVLSHTTNKDKLQAAAKKLLGKGPKVAEPEECKDGVFGEADGQLGFSLGDLMGTAQDDATDIDDVLNKMGDQHMGKIQ